MTLTIRELTRMAYEHAQDKGFHHDHPLNLDLPEHNKGNPYMRRYLTEKLALIHSEVSEALEAIRSGPPLASWTTEDGKPEGLASELADIVIRVADLCGSFGINLDEAIEDKMRYNTTRPALHGKHF